MGRGKIEIKKIENTTNRQVTYSKRRNGILKKAEELTVLCDAKVCLIMFSSTGRLHEYISPSITKKKFFEQYQRTLGIDLWSSHYENMQANLRRLRDTNDRLKKEIRQRMGQDLDDMDVKELQTLEGSMNSSLEVIRETKDHVLKNRTGTLKKKVRNLEQRQGNLILDIGTTLEDNYGLVENNAGDHFASISGASAGGGSNTFTLHRLQHDHHHYHHLQHNLHQAGATLGPYDLRLA